MSLPTAPAPGLFFWPAQWAWHVQALQLIYAQQVTQAATLASIQVSVETLMTQSADLTAAVATLTSDVAALKSGLADLKSAADAEIASVQALLDLLNNGPAPDPAVAQAIADVQAASAELEAASAGVADETTALGADDASVPQ